MSAAPSAMAVPPAGCPASAADETAATKAAASCEGRVEVLAGLGEKTRVYANPNGSFTAETAATVQRVLGSDGHWVEPDPTLKRAADGRITPVATSLKISFSGGGTGPAATLGKGGAELGLHWTAALPAPTLSGANATYADVLPGVDLVLTAQAEGFSEVLVVKNATAAANPALAEIRFHTTVKGLRLEQEESGVLRAVDDSGATLFGSGNPVMWDSTPVRDSPPARVVTPGAARRAMPVQLAANDLIVRPDITMLRDRATKFPVYIDPALGKTAWTMINSKYPDQEYWSHDKQDCPSPYASIQCAKVGYTNQPVSMIYRSIFAFNISVLLQKHVQDAKLSMDTVYSYTNTNYGTQVKVVGAINSATNWKNNSASWSGKVFATANSHAHDKVRRRTEWGVTSALQTASGGTNGTIALGLRAVDESSLNQWKKFDAGTALLTVIYNSYPSVPDQITIDGQPCTRGASRPYVRTLTPALRARVSDPDGTAKLLTGWFYYYSYGGSRTSTQTAAQTSVVSGQYANAAIPAGKLTDGGVYIVQAIANDSIDYGQYSANCEFQVDVTAPGPSAGVTSTIYPNDGQFHGGVGTAGSFTLQPPSVVPADFAGYAYTLDPGVSAAAATQVAATQTSPGATVMITPDADQTFNMRVWTRDKAGNYSAPLTYTFSVRAGTGPDARWTFDGQTGIDGSMHGNTLTASGTWVAGRGGYGKALQLDGGSQSAATGGPIATKDPDTGAAKTLHSNGSFTIAATVKLDSLTGSGQRVIVAQSGSNTSAYQLSYSVPDQKWRFAVAPTDVSAPATVAVLSNAVAPTGAWTRLLATYDGTSHALRLYINGTLQTSTATATSFDATGAVTVGRASSGSYFPGAIDDVRIYGRVVGSAEHEFALINYPNPPLITFSSKSTYAGRNLTAVLSAGGDTAVTKVKYQLGTGAATTVTLPSAGGQVTVTVTSTSEGAAQFFAWGVDAAGSESAAAAEIVQFTTAPSLTGRITDGANGNPLSGVTVLLRPGDLTTTSNATGGYTFTGMDEGDYSVSASGLGTGCAAATATTGVEIHSATVRDLQLKSEGDRFGYRCAETPNTAFTSGTTKVDLTGDDEVSGPIALPFPLPYYGKTYNQAWLSTNGVMTFSDPKGWIDYAPVSLPARDFAPVAALMPFWADLELDSQSSVWTKASGTGAAQRFLIEWRNVRFVTDDPATAPRFNFEVMLAPNGDITFLYSGLYDDNSKGAVAAVGITSPGGGYAVQHVFETPTLANNTALLFDYPDDAWPIPSYTVSGTAYYDGQPALGAYAYMEGYEDWTDSAGHYEFTDVEEGTYGLWGLAGCVRNSEPDLEVTGDRTVDLTLVPRIDDWDPSCAPTTTAFTPGATAVALNGDTPVTVPLGFQIPYFGRTVSSVGVIEKGEIQFTSDTDGNALAGGLWVWPASDVKADSQTRVYTGTSGTAPNRRTVIEWRDAVLTDHPNVRFTFEVIFDESGNQTVAFKNLPDSAATGNDIEIWTWGPEQQGVSYYETVMRALRASKAITFSQPVPIEES
ncbi:LamG-like jellyroll fold domain-containing protein [Paractinoplanes ferrugineus]|uniref:LamG-like jellyroll fold domain-containing protein n=1 Tax=Paractinoplanes ferrugineus TaxID=113564 RepID=UPI001942180A|nr:LamG-like jellyroll fold domain-containing protein [Actinoplanes ferrugineus]